MKEFRIYMEAKGKSASEELGSFSAKNLFDNSKSKRDNRSEYVKMIEDEMPDEPNHPDSFHPIKTLPALSDKDYKEMEEYYNFYVKHHSEFSSITTPTARGEEFGKKALAWFMWFISVYPWFVKKNATNASKISKLYTLLKKDCRKTVIRTNAKHFLPGGSQGDLGFFDGNYGMFIYTYFFADIIKVDLGNPDSKTVNVEPSDACPKVPTGNKLKNFLHFETNIDSYRTFTTEKLPDSEGKMKPVWYSKAKINQSMLDDSGDDSSQDMSKEDLLRIKLEEIINSNPNNKRKGKIEKLKESFENEVIDDGMTIDEWLERNFDDDKLYIGFKEKKEQMDNFKKLKEEKMAEVKTGYEAAEKFIQDYQKKKDKAMLKAAYNQVKNQSSTNPSSKGTKEYFDRRLKEIGIDPNSLN